MTYDGVNNYLYDAENRLIQVTKSQTGGNGERQRRHRLGSELWDVHDNKLPSYPLRFRLDLVVID